MKYHDTKDQIIIEYAEMLERAQNKDEIKFLLVQLANDVKRKTASVFSEAMQFVINEHS